MTNVPFEMTMYPTNWLSELAKIPKENPEEIRKILKEFW
jgi:hypothetical protein